MSPRPRGTVLVRSPVLLPRAALVIPLPVPVRMADGARRFHIAWLAIPLATLVKRVAHDVMLIVRAALTCDGV